MLPGQPFYYRLTTSGFYKITKLPTRSPLAAIFFAFIILGEKNARAPTQTCIEQFTIISLHNVRCRYDRVFATPFSPAPAFYRPSTRIQVRDQSPKPRRYFRSRKCVRVSNLTRIPPKRTPASTASLIESVAVKFGIFGRPLFLRCQLNAASFQIFISFGVIRRPYNFQPNGPHN